jgi:hypothetical protein
MESLAERRKWLDQQRRWFEDEPDQTIRLTVGVDLGQLHDPSAIVVAEAGRRDTRKTEEHGRYSDGSVWVSKVYETIFRVRFVERLPLRTSFDNVGRRVREIVEGLETLAREERREAKVYVLVDRTGLGLPAVEGIRKELGTAVPLTGVVITAGEQITGGLGGWEARVPKAHIVSRLRALLDTDRIELPATPEARLLTDELNSFQARSTLRGIRAEAEPGAHDDLVTALSLACLLDPWGQRVRFAPSPFR